MTDKTNKIDSKLAGLKSAGKHGLMAHIVVGYPTWRPARGYC